MDGIAAKIRALPHVRDRSRAARRRAGHLQAVNTVMVGAASRLLPLKFESLERRRAPDVRAQGATPC